MKNSNRLIIMALVIGLFFAASTVETAWAGSGKGGTIPKSSGFTILCKHEGLPYIDNTGTAKIFVWNCIPDESKLVVEPVDRGDLKKKMILPAWEGRFVGEGVEITSVPVDAFFDLSVCFPKPVVPPNREFSVYKLVGGDWVAQATFEYPQPNQRTFICTAGGQGVYAPVLLPPAPAHP